MIITTSSKENLEILTKKSEKVDIEEVPNLISLLERELKVSELLGKPGVGLAAPQCGINKHVAIVRFSDISINLVNAEITKKYDPFLFEGEGCLSIPNTRGKTKRFNEIVVSNNLVEPHSFTATGFLAVVIQHEIDHLNGVLFTDHVVKEKSSKKLNPNDPIS